MKMGEISEPSTAYRSTKKWERLLDRFGDFRNVLYCTTLWVVINIVISVILMNENTSTALSGTIRASVFWNLIFYVPTLLVVVCLRAVEMTITKLFKRVEILFRRFFFRSLGIGAILMLSIIFLTAIDTMSLSFLTNLSLNSIIVGIVLYLYSVVYCLMMKKATTMYSEYINGKVVTFDFPVEKRIDFGEFCFIMLEAYGPNLIENNVFGFSDTGSLLWQIDKRVTDSLGRTGGQAPFVSMSIVEDELVLFNFAGYKLKVDKCSGEVLETIFTK